MTTCRRILIATLLAALVVCPAAVSAAVGSGHPDLFDPDVELVFDHLTIDDGLPENSARAMIQDRHGFVWLGTQNGLVRYDGYDMEVHTPAAADSTSFGGRTVDALLEDSDGDIWVGTFLAGLWRYDGEVGGFSRIPLTRADGSEVLRVADLHEDAEGTLWVATEGGLASVDRETETVRWHTDATPPSGEGEDIFLYALEQDVQGRIWMGSDGHGVGIFEPRSGDVRWFRHDPDAERTLMSDVVYGLLRDTAGRIWVATSAGLNLWQEAEESFLEFLPERLAPASDRNICISLASDEHGLLWVGSASGIYVFDPESWRFRRFAHDQERVTSLVNGPILSLMIDRGGVIWAGSWHTGLNKADPSAGRFRTRTFAVQSENVATASVEAIYEDRDGLLWIGTSQFTRGTGQGWVFLRETPEAEFTTIARRSRTGRDLGTVRTIHQDRDGTVFMGATGLWQLHEGAVVPVPELVSGLPDIFADGSVKDIVNDGQGNLWFATWEGLVRWHRTTNEITRYRHDPDDPSSLGADEIITLHVDRAGRLWAGSDSRGLSLYRSGSDDFRSFFDPERGLETVSDIQEAAGGVLWLASYAGLVRFDPSTGQTEVYGRREGLPNDKVNSIVEDGEGAYWISTGYGMARFDPVSKEVRRFDTRDGLPDNEVKFANWRGNDGTLYFGGAGGLVSFRPQQFARSGYVPPVVITRVEVSDVPLKVGPDSPLRQLIHLADALELPHHRNDVSFAFSALDLSRPDQNRYRYRLDGVDDTWRDPGQGRKAAYTNLPPGEYVFHVLGSNRDGVWNEVGASLRLDIRPPWWNSAWAKSAYVLLGLALVWVTFRQLTMRERMRSRLAVQRAEAEKLQEIDELKTRFLTNITHEFRTPLTLIKVPLMRLRQEQDGPPDERYDTMIRNADRLEHLIDQLLDLSRLEAGRLPLQWQHGDCMSYLGFFVASFESLAAQREITLTIRVDDVACAAWYDADLLEKLAGNLLTNAVKHTPDEGEIVFALAAGPELQVPPPGLGANGDARTLAAREIVIAVTNTGSYIPAEDHARVFDRFYQASTASGSGVGLSLVKELTEWLGGRIEVASDAELGTCFTAVVPVFLEHPEGERDTPVESSEVADPLADASGFEEGAPANEEADGDPCILIVEDNRDLLNYMADDLAAHYRVLKAEDGKAGLELAIAEIPDLVLSDVMMPGMDGYELCRHLKEDERTSHVPVILLTARSESESRREGLRLGADDYLAKPFDAEGLKLRIHNLIEQRRKLAERYERKLAVLSPDAMPVTSADERLLAQLRKIVEANLDDPDFKVNELCQEVGMSRSQLHRKLKGVTGKATSDFVRTHRLQRAAQLLEGGYGNVTEVAYAVGFRHLSYFSRSFRDLYGVQPSEYLKKKDEAKGGGAI